MDFTEFSFDWLKQELLRTLRFGFYNLTAELAIIRSTCYQNQDKKQQLVWALKGMSLNSSQHLSHRVSFE